MVAVGEQARHIGIFTWRLLGFDWAIEALAYAVFHYGRRYRFGANDAFRTRAEQIASANTSMAGHIEKDCLIAMLRKRLPIPSTFREDRALRRDRAFRVSRE